MRKKITQPSLEENQKRFLPPSPTKTPNNSLTYVSWETTFKCHLTNLLFDWQVILLNGDRVILSFATEEAM